MSLAREWEEKGDSVPMLHLEKDPKAPRRRRRMGLTGSVAEPIGRGTIHAYLALAALKAEREEAARDDGKSFQKAKMILPHLGLVLLSVCYTLAGSMAFYWVERPYEEDRRERGLERVGESRRILVEELWTLASEKRMSEEEWKLAAMDYVDDVTRELFAAFEERYVTAELLLSSPENRSEQAFHWTIPSAVFFSATTMTTIGYGNLVPRTPTGRAFCVVFGLLGIPLMLVTIADIGKFIGDGIQVVWERWLEFRRRVRLGLRGQRPPPEMILPPLQLEIPTQLVVFIVVAYTAFGGLLLPVWEVHWDFYDSSYFSFITMSTIGFGDKVPRNEPYYWATLLYIIIGLAISTMCVDLVGSRYIQKIHYFGRKIQNARDALKTVGDLVRYTHFLRRKYTGVGDAELKKLMVGTDWEEFLQFAIPFTPKEASRFPFIDHSGSRSQSTGRSLPRSSPRDLSPPSSKPSLSNIHRPSVFDIPLPSIDGQLIL